LKDRWESKSVQKHLALRIILSYKTETVYIIVALASLVNIASFQISKFANSVGTAYLDYEHAVNQIEKNAAPVIQCSEQKTSVRVRMKSDRP